MTSKLISVPLISIRRADEFLRSHSPSVSHCLRPFPALLSLQEQRAGNTDSVHSVCKPQFVDFRPRHLLQFSLPFDFQCRRMCIHTVVPPPVCCRSRIFDRSELGPNRRIHVSNRFLRSDQFASVDCSHYTRSPILQTENRRYCCPRE